MFRLFIVDDNKYERNGLRDSIDWASMGIEVAGVFANGVEALAQMEALRPHIVLTDIAMPLMNGVQMSERIKQTYPDVKIIFLSCHSDFEFAKSAIDLGIYGYVLKPIISDELEKALHKLLNDFSVQHLQQIEKERMMKQLEEMLPFVQEQFLKEVLLGNFRNKEDIVKRIDFLKLPIFENANIQVISIKCPHQEDLQEDQSVLDSYYFSYTIKNIIAGSSSEGRRLCPVQISASDFAAIVFDAHPGAIDLAVEMNNEISRRLNVQTTMGISKSSNELTNIALLYRQSQRAVNTRFYSGSNPIILFEEIEDESDIPFEELPSLEAVYQDIKSLMSYGNAQDIRDYIDKYLNVEGIRPNENYVKGFVFLFTQTIGILLMETNLSFKDVYGDKTTVWDKLSRMDSKADVEDWIAQSFMALRERIADKNGTKNAKMVDRIKQIVKDRFHEQISIEDISKSVYLSGRHANGLFKKETGKTIFDYLIQYRIDMAKQLLKEEGSKVAAVAEAVGYLNTSYFILAFKKNAGMTPAEYKSKLAQW